MGRITSVTHSPELGHWIGIGFVKGGLDKWKDITLTPYALEKNWSLLETMRDPKIKKRDCKTEGCNWIDLDVIYYCQFCKKEKS